MGDRKGITELCQIAYKYETDKCPQIKHYYTPYYYELLKDRRETVKKVLEMGVFTGASLKMWRDFFPNAQIYGADYARAALFGADRIRTFYCDERKEEDLLCLLKQTGTNIDLFVDDGSHRKECQIFLCQTVLPLLDKGVIYVIEDVGWPDHLRGELAASGFVCHVPNIPRRWRKSRLMLVRRR